jgi:hypothetical protein
MSSERLTWEQIKQKYPHQSVGLVDVETGINSISVRSGIVKYTEKDTSYEKLLELAMDGKIHLLYTTLDEDEIGAFYE